VGVFLLLDKLSSGICEERQNGVVNLLQVLEDVSGRSSNDIFRLGDSDTGQFNSSLTLDVFD
jgi:hypothetical protein